MARGFATVAAATLLCPAAALPQVRAGGEFQVNAYTTAYQGIPAVSAARDGSFAVVWGSFPGQDGSLAGAFGQRWDAAGARRGGEFQVNTWTTGNQTYANLQTQSVFPPSIAHDRKGRFVVAWTSDNSAADASHGVFAQRYDAAGARLGGEFRVNGYTTGAQAFNEVAAAPDGGFVVAWAGPGPGGDYMDIFARRFDAAGNALGPEFRVNTTTALYQSSPDVGVAGDGSFVVVWHGEMAGYLDVFGQRFDPTGNPAGGEFRVNTTTTDEQSFPRVAFAAGGGFVVAWNGWTSNALNPADVFAQRYSASGSPQGVEFRVNSGTALYQFYPSVASDDAGNFTVAWFGVGAGDLIGVFGQRFDAAGGRRGAEFVANTFTPDYQVLPSVASDPAGNFVVAWTSLAPQDGSLSGAFGQRFGGLLPAALSVDAAGNRVLEPGEAAGVDPSWRNVNGAAQSFGGTALGFTGPPATGVTYELHDATASYGTVANGATAECTDCYHVGLTFGGTRPSQHWDAALTERITPDAHGQTKAWTVHVGASFTDVPSTNGFYRFVETLLHHGVTGGCGGTSYCPGSSTTREQMSVFVLAAKEGTGYAPSACSPPNLFGDVPESSPFCRWIEELASRGVVSGCGGGNYCPTSPVTREQMAIFVLRTLDPALDPPACSPPNLFADVPETSPFCRWIEELANRGVVTGCGGGNYCPTSAVSREQMGVFISATFGLALYGI